MLGRTEMRTRDRMYCQTIRTVRYISRDDQARIGTCNLRTPTDRLKENYSIDESVKYYSTKTKGKDHRRQTRTFGKRER